MDKTEKRKAKMNQLAELFGAKSGEKIGSSCSGKWAGTTDYSVKFDNGNELFISNGMKDFDKKLDYLLKIYGNFAEKKTEIMSILREMEKTDAVTAAENDLKSYHVVDVDYQKNSGHFNGWFYAVIEVNGITTTIQETGLHCSIRNFCRDGNRDHLLSEMSSKYHAAGGVENPVYVWHGYGFGIDSYAMRE